MSDLYMATGSGHGSAITTDPIPVDTELMEKQLRWSWPKFWIGWAKLIMDKALWVWVLFTWVGVKILKFGGDNTKEIIVISGWIGVTVIYLLGDHFKRGFEKFLENSKADLNVKLGVK